MGSTESMSVSSPEVVQKVQKKAWFMDYFSIQIMLLVQQELNTTVLKLDRIQNNEADRKLW